MTRFLRIFADVRDGESRDTLLLALNIFLILTAYYVLKPIREALILEEGSAELKSYLSAAQVVLLAFIIPLYGRLVSKVSRRRLINLVSAFFALCLVVFYLLGRLGFHLSIPFFLWIGIFNMMIVAQFWGFANDISTKDEGERLFPIVGFGQSVGAVFGSALAGRLIAPLGVYEPMLLGGALLILQAVITNIVDRDVSGKRRHVQSKKEDLPRESSGTNAFRLVLKQPYLLMMGFMLLGANWVNSLGEYILGHAIRAAAVKSVAAGAAGGLDVEQLIGHAYATYFGWTNIVSLVLQLFIVSRLVKYLGVPVCVAIMPGISLVSYNVLAFIPVIGVMLAAKVAENSTDYSLNNTVRNMLFLPCSREEKYCAKQVIDSFFVRFGDVMSASTVFIGTAYLDLDARGFAVINVILVVGCLLLAIGVGRKYRSLTAAASSTPAGEVA